MISFEDFLAASIAPIIGGDEGASASLQIFYRRSLYSIGPYESLDVANDEITLLTDYPIVIRNSWVPTPNDNGDTMIVTLKYTGDNTFSFPDCHKFLRFIRSYSVKQIAENFTITFQSGDVIENFGKFESWDDARSHLLGLRYIESRCTIIIVDVAGNAKHIINGNDEIVTLSIRCYDGDTKKFEELTI